MELDKHKTKVEFYIATYEAIEDDEQPFKEVLAVFVDEWQLQEDKMYYDCYVHLGQHSTCSESFLRKNCKKATKTQYKELFEELTKIGYNLKITKL